MSVIVESDGKKFEFRGEYRVPCNGDYYLSDSMRILSVEDNEFLLGDPVRAILHLLPETLEFGGIKFIKTGEVRMPQVGEWYLSDKIKGPVYRTEPIKTPSFKAAILKPVDAHQTEPTRYSIHKCSWRSDGKGNRYCGCGASEKIEPKLDKIPIFLDAVSVKHIAKIGYIPQGAFSNSKIESELVQACRDASEILEPVKTSEPEHFLRFCDICYRHYQISGQCEYEFVKCPLCKTEQKRDPLDHSCRAHNYNCLGKQ